MSGGKLPTSIMIHGFGSAARGGSEGGERAGPKPPTKQSAGALREGSEPNKGAREPLAQLCNEGS